MKIVHCVVVPRSSLKERIDWRKANLSMSFERQPIEYLQHIFKEHRITAVYVEGVNPKLVEAFEFLSRETLASKQA